MKEQIWICGKPARILQLGYFFDSSRYLPEKTGGNDCSEEFLFTEEILAEVILKEMGVSARIFPKDTIPMMYKDRVEKIHRNINIEIIYV